MLKALIAIVFLSLNLHDSKQAFPRPLKTGWYYISDTKTHYQRQLYNSKETYYIDPKPIITVEHLTQLEYVVENVNGKQPVLIFGFDTQGAILWRAATGRSANKKIALIIDDQLMCAAEVPFPITDGATKLYAGNDTTQIRHFENVLRYEMQSVRKKQ